MSEHQEAGGRALQPLLRGRSSPLAFDSGHVLDDEDVSLLLEAARWAPSAGNSQPWAFATARRAEAGQTLLARHLAPSCRRWALSASV